MVVDKGRPATAETRSAYGKQTIDLADVFAVP